MIANRLSRIAATIFLLAWLVACGSSEEEPATSASLVLANQSAGKGTVQNYTDAEWLFVNYFEEYGIPSELKPRFLPSLQLLANGFHVKLKRGEDAKASVEQFHRVATTYATIGDGRRLVRRLQDGGNDWSIEPFVTSFGFTDSDIAAHTQLSSASFSLVLTPEEQAAVARMEADDARLAAENEALIRSYNLPYPMPESPVQYMFFEQVMKKGDPGSSTGSGTPEHPNLSLWRWSPADIIWADGTAISGAFGIGHVGLVDPFLDPLTIVDSNPANPNQGVDIWRSMRDWVNRYYEVRQYTPRLAWDPQVFRNAGVSPPIGSIGAQSNSRVGAIQYARVQQGKPYSYAFADPWRTDAFYCSSLVWRALWESGFNVLTYRPTAGRIIYVQDVVLSPYVARMNQSKKP
jgi:hypothetical protein